MDYSDSIKALFNKLNSEFQDKLFDAIIEAFDQAKEGIIKTKSEKKLSPIPPAMDSVTVDEKEEIDNSTSKMIEDNF